MKKFIAAVAVAALALPLAACGSNADTVSKNISKEAEKFSVQRKIVGYNGITDKVIFEVEGRCSIEDEGHRLLVICKHGPDDYRKHFIGLSDNTSYITTQLDGIDVSEYRTKIVLRPESLVPDIDLVTGDKVKNP